MGSDDKELNPKTIRSRLSSIEGCREVGCDEKIGVISFLVKEAKDSSSNVLNYARINVYYTTRSVGVCRILNGDVREIFRKNCSMKALVNIVKNPPTLSVISADTLELCEFESSTEGGSTETSTKSSSQLTNSDSAKENVSEIKKRVELGSIALAILTAERESLLKKITALEEPSESLNQKSSTVHTVPSNKSVNSPKYSLEYTNENMGSNFVYQVPPDTVSHVKKSLDSEDVSCVALNGSGVVVLYENGESAYTSKIPHKLYDMLEVRRKIHASPSYVSVGTLHRYFLVFENGRRRWHGCISMTRALKKNKKGIASVAFGSKWNMYFIVYVDGSWEYGGKIPNGLKRVLDKKDRSADLCSVALGPKDEWFLKAKDGMWWGGVTDAFKEKITSIERSITNMDFGCDHSFIVQYR